MLEAITSAVTISDRMYASIRQANVISTQLRDAKLQDIISDLCIDAAELRRQLLKVEVKSFEARKGNQGRT